MVIGTDHSSCILKVDLAALKANYLKLASISGSSGCSAVVKANGYGLGVHEVCRALSSAGCSRFFVATIEEALELRREPTLNDAEIYVFSGIPTAINPRLFTESGIVPVINSLEQLRVMQGSGSSAYVLHFDTGMNRLGLTGKDIAAAREITNNPPRFIMSHLACADEPQHPMNIEQLQSFKAITQHFQDIPATLANSAGILLGSEYHFQLTRPGIALYGANPSSAAGDNPMQPVVGLYAEILQTRQIKSSESVSYGASFIANKDMQIATLSIGYADGLPWQIANNWDCYIEGYKAPLLGRVTMDLIMIDVSMVPEELCKPGCAVEVLGARGTIDDMARIAKTIPYDILTKLGRRLKRVYE